MAKGPHSREKILRMLVQALEDEQRYLRKYRRLGACFGVVGGAWLVLAILAGFGSSETDTIWLVLSGAAAGLLVGLAVFFNSSVEQWPVIREFLNVDAVRKASHRDEL
jgi:hypothetical protein